MGAGDALESLRHMVALFRANGLIPVFVFDDSDVWLQTGSLDRSAMSDAFFGRTIPMLAKEVDAGLVVSVHETYLEMKGYRAARSLLSNEIVIPRLIDARAGIDAILRDRLTNEAGSSPLESVFRDESLDHLAKMYETGRSLRDVLWVTQRALQHALSDSADVIGGALIEQAIADLIPD